MRLHNRGYAVPFATEVAWLLGSWAFSFVALGALVGFGSLLAGPLTIELHNTYFRLSTGYAAVPIFMLVATVVTLARAGMARFGRRSTNAVLALLGSAWVFLGFVIFTISKGLQ